MGTTAAELLDTVHAAIDAVLAVLAADTDTDTDIDIDTTDADADDGPAGLDDGELHRLVIGVQRERDRLGVAASGLLDVWDRRHVWLTDGSRSPAHRLARETNTSIRSAKVEVLRARKLATMPATRAAVLDGRLSTAHVDLLGRANQPWRNAVFADHEATLVEQCAQLPFHDAARLVTYWMHRADAEAADRDAEGRYQAAHLDVSTTFGGAVAVDGMLDPIGGTIVQRELARLERELYLADTTSDTTNGATRTASQRRAAALVEMARRSAAMPPDAKRPRILFSVLVGDERFRDLCELSTGTITTPAQLARWADTALLETVLFDGPTTVISVSHKRTFTGALRRAIEVRDRHCQHPSGCTHPADDCDVDHIVPHPVDPTTSQFNGRLQCPTHNRNPVHHDQDATPFPERSVTRLDELRARLRWRLLHEPDEDDPGEPAKPGDPGEDQPPLAS